MRTEDIEAFVAVVRSRSLSRAAQALGWTQPVVTRRIQGLESELGVELFDRHTKPLRPTVLGERLYAPCCQVLESLQAVRELASPDQPVSSTLRLGLAQGLGDLISLPLLSDMQRQWPEVALQVATGWGAQLLERTSLGELDAALAYQARGRQLPRNLEGRVLHETRLVVLGRRGDWQRGSYRLADCSDAGWVLNPDGCGFRTGLRQTLAAQGLPMKVQLETYTHDLQMQSVEQGIGLGLMAFSLFERSSFFNRLDVVPVVDFNAEVDLWLVQRLLSSKLQTVMAHAARRIALIVTAG